MMKRTLLTAVVALMASTTLPAQSNAVSSGYFTDGYIGRHQLNPALTPNYGYFSFPALGSPAVSTSSNLTLDKIFYPTEEGLSTFLSPLVSVEQAMTGFESMNKLGLSLNENIISAAGFNKSGRIFTSFDLGVKADIFSAIPGDLFAIAKGAESYSGGRQYDISNTDFMGMGYLHMGVGQSFTVGENRRFHIGYRARFLVGIADVNAHFRKFDATMTSSVWSVDSDADLLVNGVDFGTVEDPDCGEILDFSSIRFEKSKMLKCFSNLGFSADLGIAYDFTDWLQLSLSCQDFGMIFFRNTMSASSSTYVSLGEEDGSSTMKEFLSDLSKLTKFKAAEESVSNVQRLPMTLRSGLQVRIPQYRQVSFGLLYSQRFFSNYGMWEIRPSFNYDFARWASFSISYALNRPYVGIKHFEHMIGAVFDIHCKDFTFFIASDNIPLAYSAQAIPLRTSVVTLSLGLGFNFGAYNGDYPKKEKKSKK